MKICVHSLALAVALLCGLNASAQKADTLRRQLQVITSEDIQLEEQKPLALTHSQPRPYSPKMQAFQPNTLSTEQSLNVSPLRLLSPMPTLLAGEKHLGYISLAGGIKYNGYLSAGVRPIHSGKSTLDIYLNGRLTDYSVSNSPYAPASNKARIKEYQYGMGADYSAKIGEHTRLGLGLDFEEQQHNYNGFYGRELRDQFYHLRAKIDNEANEEARWTYYIKPYLNYTHLEYRNSGSLGLTPNEYHFGLMGDLSYHLSHRIAFGLSAEAYALTYSGVNEVNAHGHIEPLYPNMSALKFDPHIAFGHNTNLAVELGFGLDVFRFEGKTEAEINPELEVLWKFAPSWQAELKTKGELRHNGIDQLLSVMPYLNLGHAVEPTTVPINADLDVTGLITPNLSLTLFAQYSKYHNAVNFMADYEGGFTPSSASGHRSSLGAKVQYRPAQVLTLEAGAASHSWSKEIWGRPSMTLDAALTYKPSEALELNAAYELQYGIKQQLEGTITLSTGQKLPATMESLPTYSIFRFGGAYRLSPKFSVRAFGHILPSGTATLYYGHTPQRVAFNIGASYQF